MDSGRRRDVIHIATSTGDEMEVLASAYGVTEIGNCRILAHRSRLVEKGGGNRLAPLRGFVRRSGKHDRLMIFREHVHIRIVFDTVAEWIQPVVVDEAAQ